MSDRRFPAVVLAAVLFLCCPQGVTSQGVPRSSLPNQPSGNPRDTRVAVGQAYTGPLTESTGGNAFSTDLHVHGSFSEGNGSMHSTTEEGNNVGLDVIWWSDHDGFFTHYHMISTYSFENWAEASSANEQWAPSTAGEAGQTKSVVLESIDPMEYDDAEISSDEVYAGSNSLRLACASSSATPEQMLYRFNSDTKRNKRALGADVSVMLAVFPRKVTENARAVIEILLSLHEPFTSTRWEQYSLRYFLHPDPQLPRYRDGTVYNIPVAYTANQWNLLDLNVTADAIEGFAWLTGIDNSLFQLNFGVESSLADTAEVFFDDLQITTTLEGQEVLDVQQVIMDSLEARRPNVFQLQSVETHFKHMNILGEGFDIPDYDSIALAGGFMDQNGWIASQSAFEDYLARAVVDQAHARGSVVSYNHMFGANTNSTGGPDPQATLNTLAAAEVYGADLLEVGYVARGGQDLDAHLWVWDELAKQGLRLVGVGVTDAHGLSPGDWGTRQNRLISWIYADEPTSGSLLQGLKRGRVYFGDLLIFGGTVDLTTPSGFMMGQLVFTDRDEAEVTISIDGLTPGDVVRSYWDGELANTYVASQSTFNQTEFRQLDETDTFIRVSVTTASGANKAFSNPLYFLREIPEDGLPSPRAAFEVEDIHTTLMSDFTVTNVVRTMTADRLFFNIEGNGNDGVIVLNMANTVTPDSVRFEGMTGSWELVDTLLVLNGLTGVGQIEISGGSAPMLSGIPDQYTLQGVPFPPIALDNFVQDTGYPDSLLQWTYSGDSALAVSISPDRIASVVPESPLWTGAESIVFHVVNPFGFSSSDTALFSVVGAPLPPVLMTPPNGSTDQSTPLVLEWNETPSTGDTILYRIHLSTDSLFGSLALHDSMLVDTTYLTDSLLNGTVYYWRVRGEGGVGAGAWSAAWQFRTIVALPDTVVTVSPADSLVISTENMNLVWLKANPEVDRYQVELDTSSQFLTAFIDSMVFDTTTAIAQIQDNERYWWRVRAHNAAGWGEFSNVRTFTTDFPAPLPDPPSLVSPVDGAVNLTSPVTFVWLPSVGTENMPPENRRALSSNPPGLRRGKADGGAGNGGSLDGNSTLYHFQLSVDSVFATVLAEDSSLVDTTFVADSLLNGTTYHWRVRTRDEIGSGEWSSGWRFRTIVVGPGITDLLLPADSALVTTPQLGLSWRKGNPEVDRYRLELDTTQMFQTAFVDSTLSDTSTTVNQILDNRQYWWRVQAHNAAGWGEFSTVRTFTTDFPEPAPDPPMLLSPSDDAVDVAPPVTFLWRTSQLPENRKPKEGPRTTQRSSSTDEGHASPERSARNTGFVESMDADSTIYHFQLSADSTLAILVYEDSTLVDTTVQVDSLMGSTRHYWRVSALNQGLTSSWSDTWTFVTTPPADPGVPCGVISQFQSRCKIGGTVLMRITIPNSTEYAGEVITFQVDSTFVSTTAITNGTHTKAQVQLRNQSAGSHVVTLYVPGGCFQPTTVTCTSALEGDNGEEWDDPSWFDPGAASLMEQIPERTELLDNYPNPFNPTTTLRYALSADSQVDLRIHNLLGQVVSTLVSDFLPAGNHTVVWQGTSDSGREVSSGIYFVTMSARDGERTVVQSRKIVLVK